MLQGDATSSIPSELIANSIFNCIYLLTLVSKVVLFFIYSFTFDFFSPIITQFDSNAHK